MKNTKLLGTGIILIVLALLLIGQVTALGISPGRKTFNFEPNLRTDATLSLYNTDGQDMQVVIFARGDLKEFIHLSDNTMEFKASEGKKSFSYELFLPQRMDKPGVYSSEILVRQLPKGGTQGETIIDSLVGVISEVNVRVPYPGKYAEATMDVVYEDGKVAFYLLVSNFGEVDIQNAKASIHIFDADNNLVTIVGTEEKEIKKGDKEELITTWDTDVELGTFTALAFVEYDKSIVNIEKEFQVGEFFAKLLDISTDNFELGKVAKIQVLVENLLEQDLEGFSARLQIKDENGLDTADITSSPITLSGKEKKEINLYWDTEGLTPGTFSGQLILKQKDKTKEHGVRFIASKNSLDAEVLGVTGFVTKTPQPEEVDEFTFLSQNQMLLILILFVLIGNTALVVYVLRKKG